MSTRNASQITLHDDHGNALTVPSTEALLECCRRFETQAMDKIADFTLDTRDDINRACEELGEFLASCNWLSESQNREPIAHEQLMFLRARNALCLFTDAARDGTKDRSIADAFDHVSTIAIMLAEIAHTKLLRCVLAPPSEAQ
jgi:hypothetical protein